MIQGEGSMDTEDHVKDKMDAQYTTSISIGLLKRTLKGSSFCTILRYPFLVMDPKNFLKACTKFEGGARAEKAQFFGQNFPKSA